MARRLSRPKRNAPPGTRPLFPPGLPFAGPPAARIGLLPLRDRASLVVFHLLVHANAVGPNDNRCAARFIAVVVNALIDPFEVVGIHLLCGDWTGRNTSGE